MSPDDTKTEKKRRTKKKKRLRRFVTQRYRFYQAQDSFGARKKKTEEMASETNSIAVRLLTLAACALIAAIVPVRSSTESTKTVDLDIRPGGVVETFTQAIVSY